MKIALIGNGAMGKLVAQLAAERGHSVVAVIAGSEAEAVATDLSARLSASDVVVDFSAAEAVRRNVEACLIAGIPIVEGTTGWNDQRDDIERLVREGVGALVFGANFSVGVNLFYRITEYAAELVSKFPGYEAFIEEQHHSRKKDSPSGTALKLSDLIAGHFDKQSVIASTRAGSIPGTHRVGFDGPADQILLEHSARSREGFANGAIMAAEWIVGKTGFFEFGDVVDEILKN